MNFLVVLAVAVACVAADVSHLDSQAPVVRSSFDQTPEGPFQWSYETGNGIAASAEGVLKKAGEYPALAINGGYKYTAPDGSPVEVTYTADENGYQAFGNVIPTPYPIPEYIERALAYIASHPPQESYAKAAKTPFQG